MNIESKKSAMQALMKHLAMMPEGEAEVSVKEVAMKPHSEASESVADEMAESPAVQMEEALEGKEEHPELAKESVAMKTKPSVMEKMELDDLSLEELKAIKEKLKAMGLV